MAAAVRRRAVGEECVVPCQDPHQGRVWLAKLTERGMLQSLFGPRTTSGVCGEHPAARRPSARSDPVRGEAGETARTR